MMLRENATQHTYPAVDQLALPDKRFSMRITTSRLYSSAADLHSMLDMLVTVRPAERTADFHTHRESVLQ